MTASKVLAAFFAVLMSKGILGTELASTSVAPSLEECYNNTLLSTRDFRLPATMNTLIEIIRKAEEGNPSINGRELSIQLLQRFRQDGIWKNDRIVDSSLGLPYSPRGIEAPRNRVQLRKLTPGNAVTFQNNSLTALERCSLHSMISSTVEYNERGDENTVCSRISRYTMRIHKRQTEFAERVETQRSHSDCPLESGVVYTKWGAVKAGLVLAGIASGFETFGIRASNGTVDNRFGSTIAGELSEAALNGLTSEIQVGRKGGWNSTVVPKYYFLQEQSKVFVTDAEIRGGLDGLYLALNVAKSGNIRVSQLMDLYYSPRGVFNISLRACNRKVLQTSLAPTEELVKQTYYFNFLLNEEAVGQFSPHPSAFPTLARRAVDNFINYFPTLNDLECSTEDPIIERTSADILIFLDTAWEYSTIQPVLAYVLDKLDVNRYDATFYTVLNGLTTDTIINKTRSILDFHQSYNRTVHLQESSGFDYNKVVLTMENIFRAKLNNQSDLIGQSTFALLVPHNTPSDFQKQYAEERREDILRPFLPDLRVLVIGPGTKDDYSSFVINTNTDIFELRDNADENSQKSVGNSVIDRIKKIPRAVVNPNCRSTFTTTEDLTRFDLIQYVEPQAVNYHRIAPNYFFDGNDDRRLKISGQGYGRLTVCISRTEPNPRANGSSSECSNIGSDEVSLSISDYCSDQTVRSCPPIYISVEGLNSNVRCNELMCRFPDSIKYRISLENVRCASGDQRILPSLVIVMFAAIFTVLRFE